MCRERGRERVGLALHSYEQASSFFVHLCACVRVCGWTASEGGAEAVRPQCHTGDRIASLGIHHIDVVRLLFGIAINVALFVKG